MEAKDIPARQQTLANKRADVVNEIADKIAEIKHQATRLSTHTFLHDKDEQIPFIKRLIDNLEGLRSDLRKLERRNK